MTRAGQHQGVERHRPSPPPSEPPETRSTRSGGPLRGELRPRGPVHFEITESQRPDAVSLQIVGELDVLTAPRLAAELGSVLRRSQADVVVDLRQAEFIDSAGLQLLLGIQRQLSRASRKLRVICDQGAVRRVIELARLEEILGLTAGEEETPR